MLSLMAMLGRQQMLEDLICRRGECEVELRTELGTLCGILSDRADCRQYLFGASTSATSRFRIWLVTTEQKMGFAEEALRLLASRFPVGKHENWRECELLLPACSSHSRICSSLSANVAACATLLYNIGQFDCQQGRYMAAKERMEEAYKLRRESVGEEDYSTVDSPSTVPAYQENSNLVLAKQT